MFEYNDYQVNQVMNITDVDDKTITRSQKENVPLSEITQKYEKEFFDDLESLNILKPSKTLRATENISDMIKMIEELLEKGFAYTGSDGIYFNIEKSKGYGKLANLDLNNITKERISNDEYDKENARDFALWKFKTNEDGDVSYKASFGEGRPGWHIECSSMCIHSLGEQIDIHTGGTDLIFPHHTNEIAQSESYTGKTFSNYWVHGGFMTVDGKKMSKSLGNIFTLNDIKNKKINPIAFRYLTLGAHYRTLLNFTWQSLEGAETALNKIRNFMSSENDDTETEDKNIIPEYKKTFTEYINDDLNMPQALALVWEIIKDNRLSILSRQELILDFDKVFGLKLSEIEIFEIPVEVDELIKARDIARFEKNWKLSDELREKIESFGFSVSDTENGTKISPMK
jgi:cysteinyl-tRNA synthetase